MDTVNTCIQTHGTGEGEGKNTVSLDMQTKKKYFRSVDQSGQLFPRLPNEITFCGIVPKLPWRAFHVLAAVSRAWRQAIGTHLVHDARIHSCSTDTLVVHGHNHPKDDDVVQTSDIVRIAVYSVRDKLCYDLPPIPRHYRGVPSLCQCISFDGKIYVIRGALEVRDGPSKICGCASSSKVYVFDLVGASHWKECASIERGRKEFGCGVIDGKIYAFGGTDYFGYFLDLCVGPRCITSRSMLDLRLCPWHLCDFVIKFLHWQRKLLCMVETAIINLILRIWPMLDGSLPEVDTLLFLLNLMYHIRKCIVQWRNEWSVEDELRADNPLGDPGDIDMGTGRSVFVVQGKFLLMTENRIYVQDDDADTGIKSWNCIRRSPFPRLAPIGSDHDDSLIFYIVTVIGDDELFAGVEWHDVWDPSIRGSALLQSKGFGTDSGNVLWKVTKCHGVFGDVMCCIQL